MDLSPSFAFVTALIAFSLWSPKGANLPLIAAHYVGRLENGKVFNNSYSRGKPLTLRVGVGEVIKGWDEGILGGDGIPPMLQGGRRTLKLLPELGYGSRGVGCRGSNSSRMVLLKGVDKDGFLWYTNYESYKARDLSKNSHASLLFYWDGLNRQSHVSFWEANILKHDVMYSAEWTK